MPTPSTDKGIAYDSCTGCGTDTPVTSVIGNTGEFQEASIFVCGGPNKVDAPKVGCGKNWARQTKRGMERHERLEKRDPSSVRLDPAPTVAAGRTYFTGSERYRDNYARVFGHD